MYEDVNDWMQMQLRISSVDSFPRPKSGQVWWCAIGLNIGSEQNGGTNYERPVLVLRCWGSLFWGVPITSSDPEGNKQKNCLFHALESTTYVSKSGVAKHLTGYLALHQLRAYDARRLKRRILRMESESVRCISDKLRAMM